LVDEKKISEENKTKNQSFGWLVQGNFSGLQILLPNQMSFEDAQPMCPIKIFGVAFGIFKSNYLSV
jgi:hypothetical protein